MTTPRFFVEFKNNQEQLTLEFEIHNNSTAVKWYQELALQLSRNAGLKENDRLYQFPNTDWSLEDTVSRLAECANTINQYSFYIPETISVDTVDQQLLNILHKYFEEMRGGILRPAEYFITAPEEIKDAIELYNVLIHRTEDALNSSQKQRPRMVLTFQDRVRHSFDHTDYDNFSLDIKFGEVYINYCEVGKPLWDVFKDQDSLVGEQNIRPLTWYSADMLIYFINGGYRNKIEKFWNWFDQNSQLLGSLGFTKYDKKLSIGHIPVARLITNESNNTVISRISKFNKINRVYI